MASDSTPPETPQSKRLSIPDLPEDPKDLSIALAGALLQISENLRYLRFVSEARIKRDAIAAESIRSLSDEHRALEARVAALERKAAE